MKSKNVELLDLWRYILVRWKRISVLVIVVAIMSSLFTYISSYKTYKEVNQSAENYKNLSTEEKESDYLSGINLNEQQRNDVMSLLNAENHLEYDRNHLETLTSENDINAVNQEIANYENAISATKSSLNNSQIAYYNYIKNKIVPEKEFVISSVSIDKKVVVQITLVALFLYIIIIIAIYLLSGTVKYTDDTKEYYDLECINKTSFSKGKIARICRPKIVIEKQLLLAGFDISYCIKKISAKNVVFLSDNPKNAKIKKVVERVDEDLKETINDMQLVSMDLADLDEVNMITKADIIIIFALCGKTKDKKIKEVIDKIKKYDCKIAGTVIIE